MNENKVLKWMTLITSAGDYFTLFAIIQITQNLFQNTWLSAYNVAIQAAAISIAGIITPNVLYLIKPRPLFFITQFGSALAILVLYLSLQFNYVSSPIPLFVTLFVVTFFWHIFSAARETLSKGITKCENEHQNMQSELLSGFYSAQFIGPLAAVVMVVIFGPRIPLLFDMVSFIFCGFCAFFIKSHVSYDEKMHILRPFKYLGKKVSLLKILLMRTMGFWVPIGIYNYIIFKLAEKAFQDLLPKQNTILATAFIYSLIGLGALVGNLIIRNNFVGLKKLSNNYIAYIANILMGFSLLMFTIISGAKELLVINFLLAVGLGMNALSTQTIRRMLASNSEFGEIVALEVIIGRGIEWLSATVVAVLILKNSFSDELLLIFGGVWLITLAYLYKNLKTNEVSVASA